jgi:hypothetical protein
VRYNAQDIGESCIDAEHNVVSYSGMRLIIAAGADYSILMRSRTIAGSDNAYRLVW